MQWLLYHTYTHYVSNITKYRTVNYEAYIRHFNKFFLKSLDTHLDRTKIFMNHERLLWTAFNFATDNYTQLRKVLFNRLMERIVPKINENIELGKQLDCKCKEDNKCWYSLSIMDKLSVAYNWELLSTFDFHDIFEYMTNTLCSEMDTLEDCEKNIFLCTNDYKLEESNALPGVVWEYPQKKLNKTIIDGFIRKYLATYSSEATDKFYEEQNKLNAKNDTL